MTEHDDIYSQFIKNWEKKAFEGLTPEEQIQLLVKTIAAVDSRACVTLSRVTILVVLDRILNHGMEFHPVLSEVKIKDNSLSLKFLEDNNNFKSEDILNGLRFVLIDLLRVIGRITANILTKPLQNEILSVTLNEPEKK